MCNSQTFSISGPSYYITNLHLNKTDIYNIDISGICILMVDDCNLFTVSQSPVLIASISLTPEQPTIID